ncbi:uncharacterized protein DFL_002827 [Arthrobotrys flagrans]|uniref:Uncharacterized protein n=1 Tax=Arthrobotrys flagrans TaxID=97331 RepID=A0A437ACW0_ARTFL|nr:hypothetical protein DFL_002827 [Arthrobotrys flagrans]
MHSTKFNSNNPICDKSNIPILPTVHHNYKTTAATAKHRRAVSFPFPTTTPTLTTQPPYLLTSNVNLPQQDLYQQALERSTAISNISAFYPVPIKTGAISSHAQATPSPYPDLQSPDYLYSYYYYNQPKMAAYPRDIPSWAGQAAYYYPAPPASHIPHSSSPRALTAPRSSPPMYDQVLPTMMPLHSAIPESYMHQTFRDFASHAYRCDVCYDPLRVHLEGRQLCPKGHKLARKVSKALYEEANDKYRRSKTSRRRADGWQSIEVDIPKGCEVVRALINAMERGLNINSRPEATATPATPATPTARTYFDDAMFAQYQRRPGPSSDEELYSRSRSRHREEPEAGARSRSTKRSSSVGNAGRKPVVIGIQERERRPYGGAHSSNGSTDSGYDTAPGSPDNFRRGSQYAEDMKRRKERPKSILKKTVSFEREHLLEKDPQTPKTTNQEKYVFFNISGECLAPGFD